MANEIVDLVQTKVSNQESSTNGIDKEVPKDKPSLFDSLLKDGSQLAETKDVTPVSQTAQTTQTEESVSTKDASLNQETQKTDVIQENTTTNKVEDKSKNSLLDRLVLESKQKIKDENSANLIGITGKIDNLTDINSLSVLDSQSAISNGDVSTATVANELVKDNSTNVETLMQTNSSIVSNLPNTTGINTTTVDTSNVQVTLKSDSQDKVKSSLLDKLVLEAKQDIKNVNSSGSLVSNDLSTSNLTSNNLATAIPQVMDVSEKLVKTNSDELVKNITTTVKTSNNEVLVKEDKVTVNSTVDSSLTSDKKQSLMDLLIQKDSQVNQLALVNSNPNSTTEENKDFLSSIYLGNQKNVVNNQLLLNKNEAANLLAVGKATAQNVEKSADLLDLGVNSVSVEQTTASSNEIKQQQLDLSSRKSLLDKLLSEKNVKSEEIKNIITQSKEASSALLDNSININNNDNDIVVNVNSPLSYNIQSKIIGAKQQMSTMMSDIARQMYENYRPPVTVFKINLNPLELGSISILMKNDKNNSLNISMNVSNTTTLNTIMENQNVLKNALNNTFDENTNFNLDFSSGQNGNQSSNKEQNGQNSNQSSNNEQDIISTQAILQMKDENKEEDKPVDYM